MLKYKGEKILDHRVLTQTWKKNNSRSLWLPLQHSTKALS